MVQDGLQHFHQPLLERKPAMNNYDWGMWNTVQEMERMFEQMGRAISSTRRGTPFLGQATPALNIWANENSLVVTGEVPGVDPASTTISVLGDTLTVSGKRVFAIAEGKKTEHVEEFNRSIQLPFAVDADRTEARCQDGVLTITVHRPEAEKPRRIAITAA
jgi:HSP20 family protein